jgi:5-hydroxyisourate hydrolase
MSQITTHILDTSLGKPAADVPVKLEQKIAENKWKILANGTTNADGRVGDLLPKTTVLPFGTYKITFDTEGYFAQQNRASFYPIVEIQFTVSEAAHYHVPLLLNPFGYSTYRGS